MFYWLVALVITALATFLLGFWGFVSCVLLTAGAVLLTKDKYFTLPDRVKEFLSNW